MGTLSELLFRVCIITTMFTLSLLASPSTNTMVKQRRFKDVVTHGPCSHKTCHRTGDVITCCYLSALRDLGQVKDGYTVNLPKTIRLHISRIKSTALCVDTQSKSRLEIQKCTGVRISILKNTFFKRVAGLTITKTQLEHISEDFFGLFPNIKHLVIDKNSKLKQIPAINKFPKMRLQTISYIGNIKVQLVNWLPDSPLPLLREFLFSNFLEKANDPITDFYMSPFTPGKKFKAFKVRLNYQNAHVSMPMMDGESKLGQLYVGSTNIPDNLKLNYTGFNAKVKDAIFNFPVKPDTIVPDFLPSDFESRFGKVNIRFDGESYELKNLEFQRKISKDRVMRVNNSDEEKALMEIKRDYGTPKSKVDYKGRYIFKYFILDTDDLVKLVRDSHNLGKKYIVKTHFLWIKNVNYLRKSVKLHLTFYSLVMSKNGILWSADAKANRRKHILKNKDFNIAKSVTVLWRQFDLQNFYDYLTTAASLAELIHWGDDFSSKNETSTCDALKMKISRDMFEAANERDVLTLASLSFLSSNQIALVENAMTSLPRLYDYSNRLIGKTKVIQPMTSSFDERTLLYQELTKALIQSEKYEIRKKRVSYGIQTLTETLKLRIDILKGTLENEMQKYLIEEKESRYLLQKIQKIRKHYLIDMEPVKKRFLDALSMEGLRGKYNQINEGIQKLFSKLYGKENQIIYRRKHIPRPKLLSNLDSAIESVYNFTQKLKIIQGAVSDIYQAKLDKTVSTDSTKLTSPTIDASAYFRLRLTLLSKDTEITNQDAFNILSQFDDVTPDDVFKYDVIMQSLDQLLDRDLSDQTPETLAFKTSLLRLLDVTKVESEILYDVTRAQVDLLVGNYTLNAYQRQQEHLVKRLDHMEQNKARDQQSTNQDGENKKSANQNQEEEEDKTEQFHDLRQSLIDQLKLDMLLHINQYCTLYEYNTLQQCLMRKQFSLDASLPNLLHLTNELLVVSRDMRSRDDNDGTQSFNDIPIRYEYNEKCNDILQQATDARFNTFQPSAQPLEPSPQQPQYMASQNIQQQSPVVKDTQPTMKTLHPHHHHRRHHKHQKRHHSTRRASAHSAISTNGEDPINAPSVEIKSMTNSNTVKFKDVSNDETKGIKDLIESTNTGTKNEVGNPDKVLKSRNSSKSDPFPSLTPTAEQPIAISKFLDTTHLNSFVSMAESNATKKTFGKDEDKDERLTEKKNSLDTHTIDLPTNSSSSTNIIDEDSDATNPTVTSKNASLEERQSDEVTNLSVEKVRSTSKKKTLQSETAGDQSTGEANQSKRKESGHGDSLSVKKANNKRTSRNKESRHKEVEGSGDQEYADVIESSPTMTTTQKSSLKHAEVQGPDDFENEVETLLKATSPESQNETLNHSTSVENQTLAVAEGQANVTENLIRNTTPAAVSGNKKSSIIDDSLTYDVMEGTDVLASSDESKPAPKVPAKESEDLLGSWIDEGLGLKNHDHTLTGSKRSHFAGNHKNKPVRTLGGHRVRRKTTESAFSVSQQQELPYDYQNLNIKRSFINPYSQATSLYGYQNKIFKRSLTPTAYFESMYRKCNASKIFELRQNKMASLTISTNNKQFRGFEKIRIDEIKVYLHGVKTDNGMVQVKIRSGSFMHDKSSGQKRNFISQRWERDFKYNIDEVATNKDKGVSISHISGDSYNKKVFGSHPTPFNTWIISISSEMNPGLDLSNLSSIELLFSGSLVPSVPRVIQKEQSYFELLKAKGVAPTKPPKTPTKKPTQGRQKLNNTMLETTPPAKKMKIVTKIHKHKKKRRTRYNKKGKTQQNHHKYFAMRNTTDNVIESTLNSFKKDVEKIQNLTAEKETGTGHAGSPTEPLDGFKKEEKKPIITWFG
ncbi:uncharacterized protein [Clytia hemisphaerica]|uniref:Uncharacterized protein n=1 Tax=Clytia hemisphaerica TaxID=252671 RepID=A0A7M5XID0_9CNID